MRLLLIEDEPDLITYLQQSLKAENFIIDLATNGDEGSFLARTNPYDLVILDNTLPKKNGQQICQEIRASQKTMPIIILSAATDVQKKISLLNAGADDYLTKPFIFSELLARIRALLRRSPLITEQTIYKIGDIELDTQNYTVHKAQTEIKLTKKEFQLIELFMRQPGKILSRQMIMEKIWNKDLDPFSHTVESHVASLRKKIDPNSRYIVTVSGTGYKLETR